MKYLISLAILTLALLGACTFHPIVDPRSAEVAAATQTANAILAAPPIPTIEPSLLPTVTPTCTILGNINAQGVKTAFKPGDPPYSQVKLDKPGEKCFETMDDAVAAGFTPYRGR